jgi:SAM-dependent methyltransferase
MSKSADAWRSHPRATDSCVAGYLPASFAAAYLIRELASPGRQPVTVLDAGCGDGSDTVALLSAGLSVLSIDILPRGVAERVGHEIGRPSGWRFIQAECIPLPTASVAAILDVEVLPRIADDGGFAEARRYLSEAHRVLLGDGLFVLESSAPLGRQEELLVEVFVAVEQQRHEREVRGYLREEYRAGAPDHVSSTLSVWRPR